ncbi:MAG: hypothetical protein CMH94_02560 [Oceanicaulis sp.]|nr:hypothetical protein [Oceanicaulis sp.]|tara:strand:- start:177 stop:620 length:444 start_codon:yes stop_codon:yes gene_type:complete
MVVVRTLLLGAVGLLCGGILQDAWASQDSEQEHASGASPAESACPAASNGIFYYRDRQTGVVARVDRFIGLADADAVRDAAGAAEAASGRDLVDAMTSIVSGRDCDGNNVVDGYDHIFLHGAPVGFTPEQWAEVQTTHADSLRFTPW